MKKLLFTLTASALLFACGEKETTAPTAPPETSKETQKTQDTAPTEPQKSEEASTSPLPILDHIGNFQGEVNSIEFWTHPVLPFESALLVNNGSAGTYLINFKGDVLQHLDFEIGNISTAYIDFLELPYDTLFLIYATNMETLFYGYDGRNNRLTKLKLNEPISFLLPDLLCKENWVGLDSSKGVVGQIFIQGDDISFDSITTTQTAYCEHLKGTITFKDGASFNVGLEKGNNSIAFAEKTGSNEKPNKILKIEHDKDIKKLAIGHANFGEVYSEGVIAILDEDNGLYLSPLSSATRQIYDRENYQLQEDRWRFKAPEAAPVEEDPELELIKDILDEAKIVVGE